MTQNDHIRNIAIIAHVDHGKTTLVDALFRQSGLFHSRQEIQTRVMDRMDLERERGITIAAKNCSIHWKGRKINIIDTPGHADFGGEVERGLSMVDGAVVLVDAAEGPLPQTRFVLSKALAAGLKIIIVINKIDRKDAVPEATLNAVYDLLIELDGDESLLESPVLYANGREGIAGPDFRQPGSDLRPLLDLIVDYLPAPVYDETAPFRMLVSDLGYSDFLGRLAIGKVVSGSVAANEALLRIGEDGRHRPLRVSALQSYQGTAVKECARAETGDIIILAGIDTVSIGDTICSREFAEPLPRLRVDEPTVSMSFYRNTSPFAGKEGKQVQMTKIAERLEKESLMNVSIKVEKSAVDESYIVKGRGEFQMAILIETMRREGFELCVGRPHIIFKRDENGTKTEPVEHLYIDCAEETGGTVTEKLSKRKGVMLNMTYSAGGRVRIEFKIPSRGLIGFRDEFLTDTKGTGLMSSYLIGYEPYKGDFPERANGALIADRTGVCIPYGLNSIEPRGRLFVIPGDPVYEGMIIGEHNRDNDLSVNPCKTKKLTNMRAAGKDDAVVLTPVVPMTLEKAIQFINEDELVEVTPQSVRMRKRILSASERKRER